MPRTLAVVEHQPLVLDGLLRTIAVALPQSRVTHAGGAVAESVRKIAVEPCDCAIVNPAAGGAGHEVRTVAEFAMTGTPVVVLSSASGLDRAPMERACISAGARGFVSTSDDVGGLVAALRAAIRGPAAPLSRAADYSDFSLSLQEQRVLVLYASGLTVPQVALRLQLAQSTVKQYLDRVRDKSAAAGRHARTKTELAQLARVAGLIP
jgi:DNA-binding NarL/FixJ family response regulator